MNKGTIKVAVATAIGVALGSLMYDFAVNNTAVRKITG